MTAEEALRFLYVSARMKELLTIPMIAENNAKIVEAVNVLAYHLGINFEVTPKESEKEAAQILAKALKKRAKEMEDDKGRSE